MPDLLTATLRATIRHDSAPEPDACRWCGVPGREHGERWVRSKRWHGWEQPTDAQRLARMRARRHLKTTPSDWS